jgi:hypothetical protein
MSNIHPNITQAEWQKQNPAFLNECINLVLTQGFGKRDVAVFFRTDLGTRYLMFNTVPEEYKTIASAMSTLGVAINVFLDDIADQRKDYALISAAHVLMIEGKASHDTNLAPLTRLWDVYSQHIVESPQYEAFKDLLMAEWNNLLGAMFYSTQVNSDAPCDYTLENSIQYFSPNMHHAIKHLIDMCYSPNWNPEMTALAMELAQKAQVVTRIGNWVKSWQQELSVNRDITSGVFAVATDWGIFTREELLDPMLAANQIIHQIENYVHRELGHNPVEYLLIQANNLIDEISLHPSYHYFINQEQYVQGLKQVIHDQAAGKDESR